ncbi:PAS domain-containing protein [Streptomyces sp. A7024]|uniref:PAS domain-containing protein n=1 Tax=Streptomyces coryli TaxID=1128680 RepID=A0A6G4U9F0_9ACTN|nr:PAS domain-containing protein [Streptomyces coryli]NGN68859.1 PAS domain-containing protein [Streptomyces coryli]
MAEADEYGVELHDFRKRVEELLAARSLPDGARPSTLDAALVELQYAADVLWPRYEELAAGRRKRKGSTDARELPLLRGVYQRMPFAVVLLDKEGVIRRVNFAAGQLFGMRSGYATGRKLTGSLAHESRAPLRSQLAAVARGEGDRSLVVHVMGTPEGEGPGGAGALRATLTGLRTPGEPETVVLAAFQPLDDGAAAAAAPGGRTERRPRPDLAEVSRHAELLDLVDDVATVLFRSAAAGPQARLARAAEALHGRFADWVIADYVHPGGRALERVAALGPADGDPADAQLLAAQDPEAVPLIGEAARAGASALQVRPEDVEALGTLEGGTAVLAMTGATSLLCVPLPLPSGTVRGVLTLLRCGPRRAFELAEAGALDRISRHVALALHVS